jgi:hypothetical protein
MMRIPQTIDAWETIYSPDWRFDTANFSVIFYADDEELDPHDSFDCEKDVEFAQSGNDGAWFCAVVAVYGPDGQLIAWDTLGGCSYNSVREFYSAHRWQYSRRQRRWITDPKSRAWKACEARRPRRADGSRMDGHYFPSMVREAVRAAKHAVALAQNGA